MKSQSRKAKGSRLEREVAQLLRGYGIDKGAQRMPLSGAFDRQELKADIFTNIPLHIEVKNQESWSPLEYYKQAEGVCGVKTPIVVMSRNREDIYCFLLFSDFLNIFKFAQYGGYMGEPKLPKAKKLKRLSVDETSNLKFSKKKQARRKLDKKA